MILLELEIHEYFGIRKLWYLEKKGSLWQFVKLSCRKIWVFYSISPDFETLLIHNNSCTGNVTMGWIYCKTRVKTIVWWRRNEGKNSRHHKEIKSRWDQIRQDAMRWDQVHTHCQLLIVTARLDKMQNFLEYGQILCQSVIFSLTFSEFFVRKRQKYPSKWYIFLKISLQKHDFSGMRFLN